MLALQARSGGTDRGTHAVIGPEREKEVVRAVRRSARDAGGRPLLHRRRFPA
jgi:hypothetical protein